MFKGKTLLITGGTGSFGNAVLNRFLNIDIAEIRIFSRDEKKQYDMRNLYNNPKLKFYLGDVRDLRSLDGAMKGVDYVFHAAALKQVPSCEFFPLEAAKTNVFGTQNVIDSAVNNFVKKVICLSTDKAAYPINAMGISKALMEKVAIAASREIQENRTVVCLTRYGNVMGSRGSVIPLFIDQINSKKPITITDPKMTRFLMTLDDAVDLVLFAFENGNQGDLFVNKSPAASINNLARAICEIYSPNHEIKIIGTRHGEKLFETLCTREEMMKSIDMGNFFRIPSDNRDLNYNRFFLEGESKMSLIDDYNSSNTDQLSIDEIKSLIKSVVN